MNKVYAYIENFPAEVQERLTAIRNVILESAPQAAERITAFKEKLAGFKTSKGAVQFPLEKPLPLELIREIVRFRVTEQTK